MIIIILHTWRVQQVDRLNCVTMIGVCRWCFRFGSEPSPSAAWWGNSCQYTGPALCHRWRKSRYTLIIILLSGCVWMGTNAGTMLGARDFAIVRGIEIIRRRTMLQLTHPHAELSTRIRVRDRLKIEWVGRRFRSLLRFPRRTHAGPRCTLFIP